MMERFSLCESANPPERGDLSFTLRMVGKAQRRANLAEAASGWRKFAACGSEEFDGFRGWILLIPAIKPTLDKTQ
jgi:hypothetical protein